MTVTKHTRIKTILSIIVLYLIVDFVSTGFLGSQRTMNCATIESQTVGVYWDANCNEIVQSVDWGTLYPGMSRVVNVFFRNEWDKPVRLYMNTTNWEPSEAPKFMNLNWDYTGNQVIDPNTVIPVTFKLSVSPSIREISNFSFGITIYSNEAYNVAVKLKPSIDEEGYPVVDILFNPSTNMTGWLGYTLNLSASKGITCLNALGGQYTFNVTPTVKNVDGQIVLTAAISEPNSSQTGELLVARLRLRLESTAGNKVIIGPLDLTIVGVDYAATANGESLRFMCGDTNNDGQVSIADAMFIAQYLAGNRPASDLNLLNAASVSHDGVEGDKVTIADAMFIAQYLAGNRDGSFDLKG